MTKQGFRYDAGRRQESLERRLQQLKADPGFDGMLFRAAEGKTHDLCEYLLLAKTLSRDEREGLAWLINAKLQKGRRPGTGHRGPYFKHRYLVVQKFRRWRKAELAAEGRQRLRRGRPRELVIECIKSHRNQYPKCPVEVDDADAILAHLNK